MREWIHRVVDLVHRRRLERELDEELAFHRQQIEQERIADGRDPGDARRDARLRLGNVATIRETTRERWGFPSLDSLLRDTRYAARSLRRSPAFTLAVVATLSLGIGANAAMFDVTDRLMFRPLANLRDPGTVHRLYMQSTGRNGVATDSWLPYARYQDFQNWTHSFSTFAGFNERVLRVGSGELALERQIAAVSATFFDLFDAPPVRGRYFTPAEDVAPAGAPVSVVSHEFWRTSFAGREVIGEPLQIGSVTTTIIGVAHPALRGVNDATPPAVFVPITTLGPIFGGQMAAQQSSGYGNFWGSVLVRRKPGVAVAAATADATEAFRRSWEAQRAAQPNSERVAAAEAQPRVIVGSVRPGGGPAPALEVQTALWVGGVAIIVLVIACANLMNLMLSRAIARQQETATLAALGAGRGRLVTRALAESLLLALLGAVGAVAVAQWSLTSIFGLLIPNARDLLPVTSARTLAVTGAVALATGCVLGLLPMLFAWRPMSQADLKSAGRGTTGRASALRGALVVVQAALSLVLLTGAVLFANSLEGVKSARYGYEADRVLLVNTTFRGAPLPPAERLAVRQRLLDAAVALPEVEIASWKTSTPLGLNAALRFFVDGVPSVGQLGRFTSQEATDGYFAVMGTRILRGRPVTAQDRANTPRVVVVSEGMAAVLWPGKDPIGQCMRFHSETAPCTSVVGVAEDIVQTTITATERFQYYLSLDQGSGGGTGLALRMRGSPAQQADTVRRALQPLMPGMSYVTTQPMEELVTQAQRSWRLGATMFLALSGLALVVAAVGLYGVIRYNVTQRTHEMGIRAALGARGSDLIGLVVGPNLRLTFVGIVLGGVMGWAASGRIQPLLFEQSATDVRAYALAAAVLAVTALAASLAPALRATRVPPSVALRVE